MCELGQSREGQCVMLTVSSSLQTGDPDLETGHLGLLQEARSTNFDKDIKKKFTDVLPQCTFYYSHFFLQNSTLMSRDSLEVSMDFPEAWS